MKELRIPAAPHLPQGAVDQHAVVGKVDFRVIFQIQRVLEGLLNAADPLAGGVLMLLQHAQVGVPAGLQGDGPVGGPFIGALRKAVCEQQLAPLVDAHADRPLDLLHGLFRLEAGAEILGKVLGNGGQGLLRQLHAVRRGVAGLVILQFGLGIVRLRGLHLVRGQVLSLPQVV